LGNQTVVLLVTDNCGNTGTCSGTVEIVDNSMPVCNAMDITVSLSPNGNYMLTPQEVDDGSSAACGSSITLAVNPNVFDCGDIGDEIVTLTVTASGGASAQCTAVVTIEDNTPPVIVCPADMTLPCETDLSNLNNFGTPTTSDNCDNAISVTEVDNIVVNACNVGTVVRTFTATDDFANSSTCVQTITISGSNNPITEANITWPVTPFDAGECIPDPNNILSGMPVVDTSNASCFDISITFTDNVAGNTQCSGIITRTWTVTDACQAPGGVFTFIQTITISDDTGPDISGPPNTTIILGPGNTTCDTFVNLPATVMDCAPGFTSGNDSPFADDNTIPDASGTYPVGTTTVNITATDICGNDSIYTYTVTIVDTTAFISDCAKIIDNIDMNTLTVVIPLSAAQAVIEADCSMAAYVLSFSNLNDNTDILIADCTDVGIGNYTIYLWSGGILLDSCTSLLQIVDGGGFCTQPIAGTVVGEMATEDGKMIDDVQVNLIGSPFAPIMTDNDGKYAFPEMSFGGSYQVVPAKDIDYLNGVSTLDLIDIQKHILGTKKLNSPYKLIAADINKSGDITGSDLLDLRKLILGVYEELPNNSSWRLVDESYKFIDPLDPFVFDIPEDYEIFNFNQSMIIDFVGVKVGDVNNTVKANAKQLNIDSRSGSKFIYNIEDKYYEGSQMIEVSFSSSQLENIEGFQHALKIDPVLAEVIDVKSNMASLNKQNIHILNKGLGLINFSWDRPSNGIGNEGDEMFTVVLNLKSDAWISDVISIEDTALKAEAYNASGSIFGIGINFVPSAELEKPVSLYQNVPNPWTENTQIKFYTPSDQDFILSIYDINGKLVHQIKDRAKAGDNKLDIENTLFNNGGVLYYELISGNSRLMNKMLLIK
jgi:hypothetical protein